MASINFEKDERGKYVAYLKVTDDCAIHLERAKQGKLLLEQTHIKDGKFAEVESSVNKTHTSVVDFSVRDYVYPVYLKITSFTEVVSASCTDGATPYVETPFICINTTTGGYPVSAPLYKIGNGKVSPLCYNGGGTTMTDAYLNNANWFSVAGVSFYFENVQSLINEIEDFPYTLCNADEAVFENADLQNEFLRVKDSCESYDLAV